jgi:phytoene dehydrogenase-like protein
MASQKYDVIVVGGGPGGVACAALLAKWGLKPLLLEKNERVGGKAVTVSRKGFKYELWPIAQVPMRDASFAAAFKELGLEAELKPIPLDACSITYRGRSGKYRNAVMPQTGQDPTPLFDLWGLDAKEREDALQMLADMVLLPPEKVDALDDITFEEFLTRYKVPWGLYNYFALHSNASLAEPIDLASASEQVKIMQHIGLYGGGGYYVGGFGRLVSVMAEALKTNGGEVRTRARVERILVKDGQVTGVTTKEEALEAPIVISDAGIQPTVLKLVGEEHFDKSYANYVKNLIPGWGFTGVRYFLSKPVLKHPMYLAYADDTWWNTERFLRVKAGHVPEEVIMFMLVPSNYDPDMAPPGKQCIIAGTICSPNPEAKEIKMLWGKMDEILAKVWPEVPPVIEAKEQAGPAQVSALTRDAVLPGQGGECVGLGQIVGQCGKYKPSPKAPIRGLFYVGCDAGGAGMGTHQATESGIKVARMVLQYYRARKTAF